MVDMIVWMIAISVIILSVINKDSTPANIAFCCFIIGALGLFTYQVIFGEKVPSSYYGYLSFSSFVAVVAVLLFSLSRILKIKELKAVGMSMISFWLVAMGIICLAHRYWGYGYISYFHLVLLLAGVMFFVSEKWGSITVFKVLAILLANISFFYLVSVAEKLEDGVNYSNLSQAIVMESGIVVTCILFFSYYLLDHDVISETC
jgi:hypothetical protein